MKKPIAIVYKSNTGTTKQYAEMIGEETGLPVYDVETAVKTLVFGDDVAFLGWMKAGKVQGYKTVSKTLEVVALIGVGMGSGDSQIKDIRKANKVDDLTPVFYAQGGFDMDKLTGMNKFAMGTMKKLFSKKMSKKPDITEEEKNMIDLLENGGNRVNKDNLNDFFNWLNS